MKKGLIAAIGVIAVAAAIAAGVAAWQPTSTPNGINDGISATDDISTSTSTPDLFTAIPDQNLPVLHDSSLKVEKVVEGLSTPTSMVFVGNDLLITQKNDGSVRLVTGGSLQGEPALTFDVESTDERGLLGIAYGDDKLFFYLTESSDSDEIRHRVYRYDLQEGEFLNKTMILDLPGTGATSHNGGKMVVGPDGYLYVVIGDLYRKGMLQNFPEGSEPDDTSVILKVDFEGGPAANILSGYDRLASYYAYGIRNSFGMGFDPLTETLWMTENGPDVHDEINIVMPGFNSGWVPVMGPISMTDVTEDDLVMFDGAHYADPVFSWLPQVAPTDITFLDSTKLGEKYENNIFVGDFNNGNLYFFEVNGERNGLVLEGDLSDLVADNRDELSAVILGTGFGAITGIEKGPDGNLYVLSYSGNIYRVLSAQ